MRIKTWIDRQISKYIDMLTHHYVNMFTSFFADLLHNLLVNEFMAIACANLS